MTTRQLSGWELLVAPRACRLHPAPLAGTDARTVQMPHWVGFEYREFFDVPRSIVLPLEDRLLLLESAFSDEVSEYSADYQLYLLPPDADVSASRRLLSAAAIRRLVALLDSHAPFAATPRRLLNMTSLASLLD